MQCKIFDIWDLEHSKIDFTVEFVYSEQACKDKSPVQSLFKQCIFEGLLRILYNEENFKPKQSFYYSNFTWYNHENCWTNKSFICLPIGMDDHIL
jgi:hypothetical protein